MVKEYLQRKLEITRSMSETWRRTVIGARRRRNKNEIVIRSRKWKIALREQ